MFQVVVDDLSSEEVGVRIDAIKQVQALLPNLEETNLQELLTYLQNVLEDEDEVLIALTDTLGVLLETIKTKPNLGTTVILSNTFKIIYGLLSAEETIVRDKCYNVLNITLEKLVVAQSPLLPNIMDQLNQLVSVLIKGEWFTHRMGACQAINLLMKSVGAVGVGNQNYINQVLPLIPQITLLCKDETPMVRRIICKFLSEILLSTNKLQINTDELITNILLLAKDEQDSVRLLSVEAITTIAQINKINGLPLQTLKQLINDKSWRVRYCVAQQLVKLSDFTDATVLLEDLLPTLVNSLKDHEAEVRLPACEALPGICAKLDKDVILQQLVPIVKELATDNSAHVRAALASHVVGLAPKLGKDETIDQLLPIFLKCLKDDNSDVRLNLISKMDQVNDVIGIDLLSECLLPAIVELAEDKQWRVRHAMIVHIPLLSQQLGSQFFDEKLSDLVYNWLQDPVHAIRQMTCECVLQVMKGFGIEWALTNLFPKLMPLKKSEKYLYRLTFLNALTVLKILI